MGKKLSVAILVTALLTSACASQGELKFVKLTIEGEPVTIGVHDQWWPNWIVDRDKRKFNFIKFGGTPGKREFNALKATEAGCRDYVQMAHPHSIVTIGEEVLKFGIGGFGGSALGSLAFKGAKMLDYGTFGGTTGGAFGGAYGTEKLGMERYSFEDCGREIMDHFSQLRLKVLVAP